jgi:site-specific DNA-cytosine methylase
MTYKVLDLFSGLGGWSSAFWDDEDCQVIRVDNDDRFDSTICIDINKTDELIRILEGWGHTEFDLILASPPCVEFYKVDKPYYPEEYGKTPDMSLVESTMQIINHFQPPIYVIENSKHGKKWIEPHIGKVSHKIGSYFLWGHFPKFFCQVESKFKNDPWSSDPFRAAKRAKIPRVMSAALLDAIKNQTTLIDYLDFDGSC